MTPGTIKNILEKINTKFNNLECKVCIIDGQIVSLETRVTNLETTIADHETRITILEGGFTQTIHVVNQYSDIPAPNLAPGEFYFTENSQGTKWLPGSLGGTYYPGGVLYYSTGVAWITAEMPWNASQATVNAGINNDQFVTPATLVAATTVSHPGHTHNATEIGSGNIDNTEYEYLDGTTSNIQVQIDNTNANIIAMAVAL